MAYSSIDAEKEYRLCPVHISITKRENFSSDSPQVEVNVDTFGNCFRVVDHNRSPEGFKLPK